MAGMGDGFGLARIGWSHGEFVGETATVGWRFPRRDGIVRGSGVRCGGFVEGFGLEEACDGHAEFIGMIAHPGDVAQEAGIGDGKQAKDGAGDEGWAGGKLIGAWDGLDRGVRVEGGFRRETDGFQHPVEQGGQFVPRIIDFGTEECFRGFTGLLFQPGEQGGIRDQSVCALARGLDVDPGTGVASDGQVDGDERDGGEDPAGSVAGAIGERRDGHQRKPDEEGGLAVVLEVIGGIGGDVAQPGEKLEGRVGGVLRGEGEGTAVGIEEGLEDGGRIRSAEMGEVGEIDALTAEMGSGVEPRAIGKTRLETLEKGLEDHGRREERQRCGKR